MKQKHESAETKSCVVSYKDNTFVEGDSSFSCILKTQSESFETMPTKLFSNLSYDLCVSLKCCLGINSNNNTIVGKIYLVDSMNEILSGGEDGTRYLKSKPEIASLTFDEETTTFNGTFHFKMGKRKLFKDTPNIGFLICFYIQDNLLSPFLVINSSLFQIFPNLKNNLKRKFEEDSTTNNNDELDSINCKKK